MASGNRTLSVRRLIVVCAGLAVIGGAEPGHSSAPLSTAPQSEVAVVVDSEGKSAIAVLSATASGWRVSPRIPVNRGIRSIAWLPTGRKIAVTTAGGNLSNELRVIDVSRRTQRAVADARRSDPSAFFGSVAWSPDGRRIAVTRSMGLYGADLDILGASGGSLVRSLKVGARFDSALAWSRDGAALYYAEQRTDRVRPKLRKLVVRTGKVLRVDGGPGLDPSLRADGALGVTTENGIALVRKGRSRKLAPTRRGDRFPAWLRRGESLLVERPAPGCPRYAYPVVCSHVVVLPENGGSQRLLLKAPARNPTAR